MAVPSWQTMAAMRWMKCLVPCLISLVVPLFLVAHGRTLFVAIIPVQPLVCLIVPQTVADFHW